MEARKLVGWNVRRLRVAKGLTIEELAGLVGADLSYFGRLERGRVNVGIDLLHRVARQLGAQLVDLVIERPPEDPPRPLPAGRRPRTRKSGRTSSG